MSEPKIQDSVWRVCVCVCVCVCLCICVRVFSLTVNSDCYNDEEQIDVTFNDENDNREIHCETHCRVGLVL